MSSNRKIKIFVDGHCFDRPFQGTRTFVHGLYTALLQNPDVDIFVGAHDTAAVARAFPSLRTEKILKYKTRWPSILRFLLDIPSILNNNCFDYAHFQYLAPAPVAGCEYIVTVHDVLFNDFKSSFSLSYRASRNFLFASSLRRAAIKTTVSAYSGNAISRCYDIAEEQLHVIPNGVGSLTDKFLSAPTAAQLILEKYNIKNFVLYVSRIEPRKNHLLLLDTFLQLELYRQNISLVFIGEPSLSVPGLQQKMESLTPEQRPFFHWIRQVSQTELEWFYRSCRLFVYPSIAEGFGIPPLEAAVCKAPVLCSNATAMKDYTFFDPHSFDPDNAEEFKSKFQRLMEHGPSNNELDNIAATILERYSWENSATTFFKILQQNHQS